MTATAEFVQPAALTTLVSAFGEGGMYYDRFELVLPKGSQVTRVGPATIRVATGRFVFTFAVDFSGYGANLPSGFEELYLNDHEVDAYSVTLRTQTKLTWRGLLSPPRLGVLPLA